MEIENFVSYILLCLIIVLLCFVVVKEDKFYSIKKDEWDCVQSRILDNENLDKVSCIVYKKIDR